MDLDGFDTEVPLSPQSAASSASASEAEDHSQAPAFKIPSRTIAAVEHPFMVKNVDKGIDTFGPNPQFESVRSPDGRRPSGAVKTSQGGHADNGHYRYWILRSHSSPCRSTFIRRTLLQGR